MHQSATRYSLYVMRDYSGGGLINNSKFYLGAYLRRAIREGLI